MTRNPVLTGTKSHYTWKNIAKRRQGLAMICVILIINTKCERLAVIEDNGLLPSYS